MSLLLQSPSWTRRRRATASRPPRIEGTPEDVHAVGYLWLDVRGRYLRQRVLAQALHMAARRPTILILAEAQSKAGPEDPPVQDYTRHVVLPAHGKTGAGLDVYVRAGTTCSGARRTRTPSSWRCWPRGGSTTCWRPMPPKSTLAVSHMCDGGQASGARSPTLWTRRPFWC